MWDTYWIKKPACITKAQWEDPASICLHRTLFPLHNIPTLRDTIMCQTWKRTHSPRGVGDLLMGPRERTGARIVWDHLIQFLHPWTTRLPDRPLTAPLSTVTCILQDLRCYRRRRTLTLHNFLLTEKDAIRTSGWVKLRNRLLQVSSTPETIVSKSCYLMGVMHSAQSCMKSFGFLCVKVTRLLGSKSVLRTVLVDNYCSLFWHFLVTLNEMYYRIN